MPKLHIRYAKKSDVPQAASEYYTPANPAEPDGPQIWDGFEPDPSGLAVVNATKLQNELARMKADKGRSDAAVARLKKKDADEIWTPEEIEAMQQAKDQLAELQGKMPNVDDIRKQAANDVTREWKGKHEAAETKAKRMEKLVEFFKSQLQENIRARAAAEALAGLTPMDGLEDVALDRFGREIDVVPEPLQGAEDDQMVRFVARVKGDGGVRVDANGQPLDPKKHARGEFLQRYGSMFRPIEQRSATGANGSRPGADPTQRVAGKTGSGRFRMKQADSLANVGAMRAKLKTIPKDDGLQIVNDAGDVIAFRRGEA